MDNEKGGVVVPLKASQNLSVRVALRYGFLPRHRDSRCVNCRDAILDILSYNLLIYNDEVRR